MKKQLLCGALALGLALTPAAAFTDITDVPTMQAASVLGDLGIMNGESDSRFNPSGALTRAEFCKLAVTALGITDVSAYQNYTIFPDVPSTHWAAGYVGAILKAPDLAKKQIIRGTADGRFQPDDTVTYGEACTMLLRMLGYTVADVGPFWPNDYISKAVELDLTENAAAYGPNDVIRRGDAAIMLLNTLQATPKEGEKLLTKTAASNLIENSILLATASSDGDLRGGQARFYENGTVTTRPTAVSLDESLIGTRGTVLFDKTDVSKVRAFLPKTGDSETITVSEATASKLTDSTGARYDVPRGASIVLSGEVTEYGTGYFDLAGRKVNLYFDSNHEIELISAAGTASSNAAFVFGTTSGVKIPQNYKIIKNGAVIDQSKLKRYDVVALDHASQTATVSDQRVTGYYAAASPSFSHPSQVTVLGKKFEIPDYLSGAFQGMKYNDRITLLLDGQSNVKGVYPATEVTASMVGVCTGVANGKAVVSLLNGVQVSGKVSAESLSYAGQFVTVTDGTDGQIFLGGFSLGAKPKSPWDVKGEKLGTVPVSGNVKLYEWMEDSDKSTSAVSAVSASELELDQVPVEKIHGALYDTSGSVVGLVLSDVIGSAWQYGVAYTTSKDEISSGGSEDSTSLSTMYSVELITFEDGQSVIKHYSVNSMARPLNFALVGLPRGMDLASGAGKLPVKELKQVGTVGVDAFDGTDGVKTADGYYEIADDIGVYVEDYGKMISLREAKTNFRRLTLYADKAATQGGKIRLITAQN